MVLELARAMLLLAGELSLCNAMLIAEYYVIVQDSDYYADMLMHYDGLLCSVAMQWLAL